MQHTLLHRLTFGSSYTLWFFGYLYRFPTVLFLRGCFFLFPVSWIASFNMSRKPCYSDLSHPGMQEKLTQHNVSTLKLAVLGKYQFPFLITPLQVYVRVSTYLIHMHSNLLQSRKTRDKISCQFQTALSKNCKQEKKACKQISDKFWQNKNWFLKMMLQQIDAYLD